MKCCEYILVCSVAVWGVSLTCLAQPLPPQKPLDQAVEDAGALSTSLRDTHIDLRQPVGFLQVFHVPGHHDLLMRSSGALHAVFPHSQYVRTRRGLLPLIPAGTVFHIGLPPLPPSPLDVDEEDTAHPQLIDARRDAQLLSQLDDWRDARLDRRIRSTDASSLEPVIDNVVLPQRGAIRAAPPARTGPTVANDEEYRVRRLEELMRKAVQSRAAASDPQAMQASVTPPEGDRSHHQSTPGTSAPAPNH